MKCKKLFASLCVGALALTTLASAAAPGTAPLEAPPALENTGENAITPFQFAEDYSTNASGFAYFTTRGDSRLRFYITNNGTDTVTWKIQQEFPTAGSWWTHYTSSTYGSIAPGKSIQFTSSMSFPKSRFRFVSNNSDGSNMHVTVRVNQLDVEV